MMNFKRFPLLREAAECATYIAARARGTVSPALAVVASQVPVLQRENVVLRGGVTTAMS
jgi:hypothetical protein